MAKEEQVWVNGEFVGWEVTTEERWETVEFIGGKSYSVKVQDYSKLFIPKDNYDQN